MHLELLNTSRSTNPRKQTGQVRQLPTAKWEGHSQHELHGQWPRPLAMHRSYNSPSFLLLISIDVREEKILHHQLWEKGKIQTQYLRTSQKWAVPVNSHIQWLERQDRGKCLPIGRTATNVPVHLDAVNAYFDAQWVREWTNERMNEWVTAGVRWTEPYWSFIWTMWIGKGRKVVFTEVESPCCLLSSTPHTGIK